MSIRINPRPPTARHRATLTALIERYETRFGVRWIIPPIETLSDLQVCQHVSMISRRLSEGRQ